MNLFISVALSISVITLCMSVGIVIYLLMGGARGRKR